MRLYGFASKEIGMRKKMFLLILALVAVASSLGPQASAATRTFCPICTTYPDGSTCCVSCICENGHVIACTNNYCP
jgi:hypothetical protein